jgi:hypothetical protein
MGGRMCRRQYSGSRFHGGFVLVLAIVAGIGGAAYIGFMVLVVGSFGGSFPMGIGFILTGVLILILGFSIMFYLFNLPFQLLAILNRTYNQRLRAILQIDTPIESPLTEPPPSTPDPPDTP